MSDISFNIDSTADTSFNISESTGIDFSISSSGIDKGAEYFVYGEATYALILAAYEANKAVYVIGDGTNLSTRYILPLLDKGSGNSFVFIAWIPQLYATGSNARCYIATCSRNNGWTVYERYADVFRYLARDFNSEWESEYKRYKITLKNPVPDIPDETNNYVLKSIAGTLTWVQE